ncbi:hypothetical protein INR79_23425 [Vibrio sp. SCSIO 43132]|uniref:hypothetical protein n=1 Tax=Vibrio sp. SCSIO 43132 TaxID=2779363 RepID=UPI001CA7B7F7|nr:hypothetical protein [Vibrio sp. SCSIO 43132]UAB72218.1 hypothetical protein INR79_23425 [Vibrio sp. SCSIO 43132]
MKNLVISVGALESVASVYSHVSNKLVDFNSDWKTGDIPHVTWDLTSLKIGKIDVSACAFFLAIAKRVDKYSSSKQEVLLDWNPKIIGFLEDIEFFLVADKYELFDWPFTIGGGRASNISPYTKILSYPAIRDKPNITDKDELDQWKMIHRESYRHKIVRSCESLFSKYHFEHSHDDIATILSRTCSELVTNSLLWGDSTAFVGLQRNRYFIEITVVDVGVGLRRSLRSKNKLQNSTDIKTNVFLSSIAIASTVNYQDFGLKRAINTVVGLNGTISISSERAEIVWANDLWRNFNNTKNEFDIESALNSLPIPSGFTKYDYERGFTRLWDNSIRGTRITFRVPTRAAGNH